MRLNLTVGIDRILENMCNQTGTLLSEIMNITKDELINRIAYSVDPGSVFIGNPQKEDLLINSEIKPNRVYKDIHVYDYTELYTMQMQQYDDDFTFGLSEKIKACPSPIKAELFRSKYYSGRSDLLKNLFENNESIEVNNTIIKTVGPARDETGGLVLLDKYTHLLTLGKISFIAENWRDELIKVGTSKIVKPKFKLGVDFLHECLDYLFEKSGKPEIPEIRGGNLNRLILEAKVKDRNEYPPGSDKFKLATQLNRSIATWVNAKYYMTTEGPVLVDLITENHVIDVKFYEKELANIAKILKFR